MANITVKISLYICLSEITNVWQISAVIVYAQIYYHEHSDVDCVWTCDLFTFWRFIFTHIFTGDSIYRSSFLSSPSPFISAYISEFTNLHMFLLAFTEIIFDFCISMYKYYWYFLLCMYKFNIKLYIMLWCIFLVACNAHRCYHLPMLLLAVDTCMVWSESFFACVDAIFSPVSQRLRDLRVLQPLPDALCGAARQKSQGACLHYSFDVDAEYGNELQFDVDVYFDADVYIWW